MPFRRDAVPTAEDWLVLARSESSWLGWALTRRGLPSLPEMLLVRPVPDRRVEDPEAPPGAVRPADSGDGRTA
jgi:hypothetical protein